VVEERLMVGIDELSRRRLAGYVLGEEIGRGGMGVVYRATHVHLGREVALKVLAPELADNDDFRERFLRESRLAASLDHPHVVTVYDAGEVEGTLYIAMRYIDGTDLANLVRRDGLPAPAIALSMLEQVGGALDAAHERGLIHRDVKPANVLIAAGNCYLTDFGLAKRASAASTALTRSGQLLGTVAYVAPEQIEGRGIDGRADIYALTCMLH
jgi:serine/threonine protein kinase